MTRTQQAKSELGTLLRFGLVGGGFSLFFAIASAALINYAGTPPFWTNVILFAACIPPAYLMQQRVAFRKTTPRKGAVWIYGATQIGSIAAVSLVTTQFITYDIRLDTIIMGITVTIAAGISFLIGRFVTFK